MDGDAFTADECSSVVTDYAEAASVAAYKSQFKAPAPIVATAAVSDRYNNILKDNFSLVCVASIFGYYLAIKQLQK